VQLAISEPDGALIIPVNTDNHMNKFLTSMLSWLTTLLTPVVLLGVALRMLLTPLFLQVEYRIPNFPPDEYGFSTADRLEYAPYALNYLLKDVEIAYLEELTFPDGTTLFNPRELSHMQDVKGVIQISLRVWIGALLFLFALGIWARSRKWGRAYLLGLRRGGWLSIGLVVAVGLFAGLAFWQFFTAFHSLFFEGNSWLFLYSDTLIRLFPMRFWQDAFLAAALIVIGGGIALVVGLRRS
jgi:integral membrane protein (TIGR01906 family)